MPYFGRVAPLNAALQDSIRLKFPDRSSKVNKFELSPLTEAVIEARFLGPDPAVLDSLVGQAIESCAAILKCGCP